MMTVEEAITGRRCIRAFLPKPVPRELIERILLIAGRAPSGSNVQPWKVWVLDGAVKDEVSAELADRYDARQGQRARVQLLPREVARALPGAAARLRLGPLRHARHRPRGQGQDARPAPAQLPVLRRAGGAHLLHRPRPGAGLLARLRHVPAEHHGGGAPVRPRDLPAGGLPDLPRRAAEAPRHSRPSRPSCAAWRSATPTRATR